MTKIKATYLNARDCLKYGYPFGYLNYCGISESLAKKIWKKAKNDLIKEY